MSCRAIARARICFVEAQAAEAWRCPSSSPVAVACSHGHQQQRHAGKEWQGVQGISDLEFLEPSEVLPVPRLGAGLEEAP